MGAYKFVVHAKEEKPDNELTQLLERAQQDKSGDDVEDFSYQLIVTVTMKEAV